MFVPMRNSPDRPYGSGRLAHGVVMISVLLWPDRAYNAPRLISVPLAPGRNQDRENRELFQL